MTRIFSLAIFVFALAASLVASSPGGRVRRDPLTADEIDQLREQAQEAEEYFAGLPSFHPAVPPPEEAHKPAAAPSPAEVRPGGSERPRRLRVPGLGQRRRPPGPEARDDRASARPSRLGHALRHLRREAAPAEAAPTEAGEVPAATEMGTEAATEARSATRFRSSF